MAGSVNMQILVGNLGKDPEIKTFDNGERVANFTVATSQVWRDKFSGERKERTQWHNIAVHTQPLVDIVEKYARKGNKIYIQGQTEKRKYTDRNGVERETAEVVLRPYNVSQRKSYCGPIAAKSASWAAPSSGRVPLGLHPPAPPLTTISTTRSRSDG